MGRLTENQIMGLYAQFTREGARLLHEETPSVRGIGYRLFVSYVTVYLRSRRDHYRPAERDSISDYI